MQVMKHSNGNRTDSLSLPTNDDPVVLVHGDVREVLKGFQNDIFQCAITSPPYWGVRDYGVNGQIGAEPNVHDYVSTLVEIFSEVRRVLKPDGTFWLNIANTYTSGGRTWRQEDAKNKGRAMSYRPPTPEGLKKKDLIGVAWMLAMACQQEGWYLRSDIIWHKPNCQPESVKDRVTVSHEYLFMLTKSEKYKFKRDDIMEKRLDGNGFKNRRTVWPVNTEPYPEAHFAVFPKGLVKPCVLAGTDRNDLILDPFFGSGTVGLVAKETGRRCVGVEIKDEYVALAKDRTKLVQTDLIQEV